MLAQMFAPAAVLALWTLIMLWWMAGVRLPALGKVRNGESVGKPGGRGQDLEGVLPDKVNWKSHNHTHLHEQPTVFYIVTVILALTGPAALDVTLAWVYVALRIVHSLWQSLVNTIPVRLGIFAIGSIVLTVLAVRAVMATLLADPGLAPA